MDIIRGRSQGDGYRYENWTSDDNDAPILTDIEFTNSGDLVLGYNSRSTFNRYSSLKGDIRKMCLNSDGTYTDEKSDKFLDSTCATHEEHYKDNPTTYYEFYTGDFFGSNHGEFGHSETASGALAQAPGAPNIIVGMIDGTDWYQPGAIGNYDNTSGDKIGAQAVIDRNTVDNGGEREPYGAKAGGMGDVELLCDPAPIEIGNLVWVDINQNGIQDAAEPAYPNVPVKLQCKENGAYVDYGTVNTDSKGHYYFGGIDNTNLATGKQLVSGLECKLSVAKSDVNNKPATTQNPNNDANDTIDNDAAEVGSDNVIEFTLSNTNNHNLDFGIEPTIGCLVGVLYNDVNNNGSQDGTDTTAPAGITVKATDMFGNTYSAQTDENGTYEFNTIPAGDVTITIDTTDTDIPDGTTWVSKTLTGTVTEGTAPSCLEKKFPYTLPSPKDQDPKDSAVCAQPTSLTWDDSTKSTATVWQNIGTTNLAETTAGGNTVGVTMHIVNDDGKLYDTDTANSSGSGTGAAFGKPYLTLYLGSQANAGDGNYGNTDGAGCANHGYELEAGQKIQLVVDFNESVVLDNWRIRDVDSGDMRNGAHDWEWQDGIKVSPTLNLTLDFGFATVGDWSGNVSEDLDNNDTGDKPIANVTIKLYSDPNCDGNRADGTLVAETNTSANGNYKFENEVAGCYVAVEEQPSGYFDVIEKDGGDDNDSQGNTPTNEISGKIDPGEEDSGNNFVEEKPGNWCGKVELDNNADDVADEPIKDVEIKLYPDANADGKADNNANPLTATTDSNGKYCFNNIRPGHYVAVETQPAKLRDINETEGGGDSDMPDNGVKNAIAGMVYAAETDDHNDFLEGLYRIGTLFWIDDNKNSKYDAGEEVVGGAKVELFDGQDNKVAETTTDAGGHYHFDVPEGEYYVKFHLTPKLKKEGYIFSKSKSNNNNNVDINTAGDDGITQKIFVVGENIQAKVLTLDAGVNCGCSNVSNDSASALNFVSILFMILFGLFLGFKADRKENI